MKTIDEKTSAGIDLAYSRMEGLRQSLDGAVLVGHFLIADVTAVNEYDSERVCGLLVCDIRDEFGNGDCVLFGYDAADFSGEDEEDGEYDLVLALQDETPSTYYECLDSILAR